MIKEFQGKYRWLSNFWPVEITYKGRVFHNVENAYMSEKNNSQEWKIFCLTESDPKIVKKASFDIELRKDWEEVKVPIMTELVRIKFQNPELHKQLLRTGSEYLQEGNTWKDIFWGVDLETGVGENNLGKIIMRVREEIKKNHVLHQYVVENKKIILFDGECNLCAWWVEVLLRNDPRDTFRFASLQSDIGKEIQKSYNIDTSHMDSVIVTDNYTDAKSKTSALFSLTDSMGGLWPLFKIFWIVPRPLRDWLYSHVSKHRYGWFGKKNTCMVMTDDIRHKFLDSHE